MTTLTPDWRGWPWLAALTGAVIALITVRHGFVPGNDSVSYWSAARSVSTGHPFSSGLIPSFSDLDLRAMVGDGRAPFVDFPVGYPLLAGGIAVVTGLPVAQLLLMVVAAAGTCWLIVRGPTRATSYLGLVSRAAVAWLAISLPIAVEVRQAALPEPLFVAGLLGFCLLILQVGGPRHDDRALFAAAGVGAVLGLVRFVGLPLVVVLAIAGWRAGTKRSRLAAAIVLCALPGVWNATWASGVTGRHPQLMSRSRIDIKFAAHSIGGWFSTWRTSVADVLSPRWSVPALYYVVAAVALAVIVVGALQWLRKGRESPAGALARAVAGALLASVVLTMIAYDALTKFEPRMLYPPAVLLAAAWAWSPPQRLKPLAVAGVSVAWALAAAGPWNWRSVEFQSNTTRVAILRDADPAVIVSNSADTIHYETGIPAAYFPAALFVHSGAPRDRAAVMADLPCRLLLGHGLAVLDTTGYLPPDPWVMQVLAEQETDQLLTRTDRDGMVLFAPTPTACSGR
jgi:hypothetical protein